MIVTINGPDGSGKGTILQKLIDKVDKTVTHVHSRPGNLLTKPKTVKQFVEDPGRVPEKPKLAQFAKIGLFLAEFHTFGLWQRLTSKGSLVVLERSLADLSVHPQRYGLNISLPALTGFLVKEWYSDLDILLTGDSEQIAKRKGELEAEDIHSLSDRYLKQLSGAGNRLLVLDTTRNDPDAIVDAIMARIEVG